MLPSTFPADALCLLLSLLPGMPDGTLDTVCTDETGSEEDLYEELHTSGHHYSHPRGGGEQLAINEVVSRRLSPWKEGHSGGPRESDVQLCFKAHGIAGVHTAPSILWLLSHNEAFRAPCV